MALLAWEMIILGFIALIALALLVVLVGIYIHEYQRGKFK